METLVAVMSRLVASVIAMTISISFNHRLFIGAYIANSTVSSIVSGTKDVMEGTERIGRIRYHYFNEFLVGTDDYISSDNGSVVHNNGLSKQCSDILMIGVGTAMSVEDYDKLAESIVTITGTSSLVVVISDPNPGRIVKLSSTKYASLSNGIKVQSNIGLIPVCTGHTNKSNNVSSNLSSPKIRQLQERQQQQQQQQQQVTANFLIGGHSASGQTALEAAQKGLYDFVPDGFVGLDPYDISEETMEYGTPLQFPTLNWGLTRTTCFVQVEKAALGAYRLSSSDSGRVLYLIDNNQNDMTHCVFTDDGCGVGAFVVCPTNENFEWVYGSVAESIHLFVKALKTEESPFTKEEFELPSTVSGDISLFVNSDDDDNIEVHSDGSGRAW